MTDKKPRRRADVTSTCLEAILLPFCSRPSWINCPESFRAPFDQKLIVKRDKLIGELHQVASNLSFVKTIMEAALRPVIIHKVENQQWALTEAEQTDSVQTITARIRTVCRHVAQAMCKKHPLAWLRLLPIGGTAEKEGDKDIVVEGGHEEYVEELNVEEISDEKKWFFKWDTEFHRASRVPQNKPRPRVRSPTRWRRLQMQNQQTA